MPASSCGFGNGPTTGITLASSLLRFHGGSEGGTSLGSLEKKSSVVGPTSESEAAGFYRPAPLPILIWFDATIPDFRFFSLSICLMCGVWATGMEFVGEILGELMGLNRSHYQWVIDSMDEEERRRNRRRELESRRIEMAANEKELRDAQRASSEADLAEGGRKSSSAEEEEEEGSEGANGE